jgi:hypothetical protein
MSKKSMVLAVISAAFLALPAIVAAQEIHFEPGEAFTASGGGGDLGFQASQLSDAPIQ